MNKLVLITAVALMSSCGAPSQYYENRVTEDVICPLGMSAYHLPGYRSQAPGGRRDMICIPNGQMRQMAGESKSAGQQVKKPESTVVAQPAGDPPAGAIKADVGFSAPGTRWRARFIDAKGVTTTDLYIVVDDETRDGKPVHRMNWGRRSAFLYDKETANIAVRLRDGKESVSYALHDGTFDWPLYVGKSWKARYIYRDLDRQTTIDPVQYECRYPRAYARGT